MRYIITSLASVLLCCKISNHLAGTACGLVVAYDKSCCFTLGSFELLSVSGSVGVPDGSYILNHRSDERSVALGIDLAWASGDIHPQESKGGVCLFVVSSTCLFQDRLSANVTPRNFPCFTISRS